MSCFLDISGWKILRTFLNPQAMPAVKKKKCLPYTCLFTSCSFPSTSCSTGSVETGSDHLPSLGHLGQGAVNINTPRSRVLGKGHPSRPHTQRPGATSECDSPVDDLKVFTIITGFNRMDIKPEAVLRFCHQDPKRSIRLPAFLAKDDLRFICSHSQ